ncbi:hypothetical protein [Bradyrhizobium japonicum]|uniref:hypothetical protein n=1 Tax=Bradyrhizobium japonicum TaxID=375 RepID=UPI001BA5C2A9|nr:hypothetical protein [Bradyrhizobium japonicum]MBR0962209.1 hypothetical protein [Bradyrhizobium japonicum]
MNEVLPGVLAEIAELVGNAKALQIAAHAGGTRVYFPSKVHPDHWLVQCIGLEATTKLLERFAGDTCDIPQAGHGSYARFRRAIVRDIAQAQADNKSSKTIAREVGVSQRTVHRHRERSRRDDGQGSLF